ncbi:MAG: AAA family ATPase [Bacteroidota bacterium]
MPSLLYRFAEEYLHEWRYKKTRRPLILRGARQVGKSSLVRKHAQSYKELIELNLELPANRELFEGLPPVSQLVDRIALRFNLKQLDENTLLFIDEIQESPEAIQQLRYLYEEYPEIPVIAAGSLLELALGEVRSFPVGRVEFYTLHPLSFKEYLIWMKLDALASAYDEIPVRPAAHQEIMDAFHRYTIVGGMPEIVETLAKGAHLSEVQNLYELIWSAYRSDAEKYAKGLRQREVLRHLLNTAANADDRIKLAGFGGSNFRSDEVGPAFQALRQAGILRLIYPSSSTELPVVTQHRKSPRIQLLDTGLLNYARGIQSSLIDTGDLSSAYKGRIAQHIVTQGIIATHYEDSWEPHFWAREKSGASAEVDLLLEGKTKVYPMEVKSGPQGRLRSLHQFVERAHAKIGLRALNNAFLIEQVATPSGYPYTLVNMPYYHVEYWRKYVELALN